ncbi:hypothetical protein [Paracoccus sp. R86501]|uniref:hypothetical protein n=1 Tax=Paracoccus sp. R86501 TaxID=3101711 RepID=UPI00366E0F3F
MRMLAIMLIALPLPAFAFTAQNGMEVQQLNQTDIAVPFESGRLTTEYWCAAGDLANKRMQQPVSARIWRATPKPRGRGEGLTFTLDQTRKAEGAGLSEFGSGEHDGAISVGQAVSAYCDPIIPDMRN